MPTEYSQDILNRFIPEIEHDPTLEHPTDPDQYTRYGGSMILSGVINDNGEIFDFFNHSHHISDSGKSYIYSFIEPSGMYPGGRDWNTHDIYWETIYGSKIENYQEVDNEGNILAETHFLNSNQIIDLDTEDPYGIFSAGTDLGEHIDKNDDNCFYGMDSETVISAIDRGKIFQFCILFHMYYYDWETGHPDWWDSYSPYFGEDMDLDLVPNRLVDKTERLWYISVSSSVDNGTRQWDPQSLIDQEYTYITDYSDGYSQGHVLYHPYQTYNIPGLVFECFKPCKSSQYYVVRSLNEFDEYAEYEISREDLDLILRGVHYGMRHFVDANIYSSSFQNISDLLSYLIGIDYPNNPDYLGGHWFKRSKCYNTTELARYNVFELDEPNQDPNQGDPDSLMMTRYLNYISTTEIDGSTYDTASLDDSGDPIEDYKFPVFIMCTGDQEFGEVINSDDLSGTVSLEIIKNWDDDNHRAVRPDHIDIDLYMLINNSPVFYRTLTLTEKNDRENERLWRRIFDVYKYINGEVITYVIREHDIPAYDDQSNLLSSKIYDATYDPVYSGEFSGGTTYIKDGYDYSINITNSVNNSEINRIGDIPVNIYITKNWEGFDNCESTSCNCRAAADGYLYISGVSHPWSTNRHPIGDTVVSNIAISTINTSNYIMENLSEQSWIAVFSHSDNYRHWIVTNICDEYTGNPIDDSEIGNIFYFEVDNECLSLAADNMVQGFGVSGNWREAGSRPLVYKICYHPDNFTGYTPGSQEYYDWLQTGWTPYVAGANLKDNNGYLIAGSQYSEITPRTYNGEDIIVPYNGNLSKSGLKARIYIGAEKTHRDRLGTFKLSTFSYSGNGSYNKYADNTQYPYNASRGVPIRCGGYINSLYGLTVDGGELLNQNYQDGDIRTGDWDNWVDTEWLISNIRVNGTEKYSKQYVFSNKKTSDSGTARVDDWIHSRLEFRLSGIGYGEGYIGDTPERWALGGIDPNEVKAWYTSEVSHDSWNGVVKGGMYANLFKGNHNLVDASQLIIPLPYCDLMYFQTFADTGLIPGNTIASSWISSRISVASGVNKTGYYPQWAEPQGLCPYYVFGGLRGMYKGCRRIAEAYPVCVHASYINRQNNPLFIGMHYFDDMFNGVIGLKKCYKFNPIDYSGSTSGPGALGTRFPWGACMNMFANTHGCWYTIEDTSNQTDPQTGTQIESYETNWTPFSDPSNVVCQIITDGEWFGVGMISTADDVYPHAFRGMFMGSNACYFSFNNWGLLPHNRAVHVRESFPPLNNIPAFLYANMFNSSTTEYPLGCSDRGGIETAYFTGGISFSTFPGPVDDDELDLPGVIGNGAFWGMFRDSNIRYCTVGNYIWHPGMDEINCCEYGKWSFGYMFTNCKKLGHINGHFKFWSSNGNSHKKWLHCVVNDKTCVFKRIIESGGSIGYWPKVIRGENYIPTKWSVIHPVQLWPYFEGDHGWDTYWVGAHQKLFASEGWQRGYVLP